jgi:hypothetical protein
VSLVSEVKDTGGVERKRTVRTDGHVTRGKACGNRRGSEYGSGTGNGKQQRVNVESTVSMSRLLLPHSTRHWTAYTE